MCGINGFSWSEISLIKKMNQALRHRGPDDEGVYVDDNVSLGHVRLSIIDLSSKGHQPMKYNKDGREVWIVYNGEIYNFKEIKDELKQKGYEFDSNTDTEVILAAYLEWGPDCVERFNGMWAFAIYDKTDEIIFLSRDRFGIKPLYYYHNNNNIVFSSEIKGILIHPIKREPNDAMIFDYLYYNLLDHTEDTFFRGIKRLMPGHNAIFDIKTGKLKIWRYYDLKKKVKERKENNNPQKFRRLFFKSVKRRLLADVPVGSCLSGGIDSSSISCVMRSLLPEKTIKVFSLVFPCKEVDESRYQKVVVKKCNFEWFKTTFTPKDILNDLEDLIKTQEEPFLSLSVYGHYKIMKLAKKEGMKVLLDGQGSDEILAGYHSLFAYYYYELFKGLKWRTLLREVVKYKKNTGSLMAVKYFIGLMLPHRIQKGIIRRTNSEFLSKEFLSKFENIRTDVRFRKKDLNTALTELVTNNLQYLLRFEDKNAMRWSIETRVPFLDPELVEFVLATPSNAKIRDGTTKFLLRDALRGIVPDEILNRKDKVAFETPDRDMATSTDIKEFIEGILTSEQFKNRPYWDWRKVYEIYKSKRKKGAMIGDPLWRVIITEMWLRVWIDKPRDLEGDL